MLRAERTAKDTMRANREALYRWRIVPRMLRDVSKRDLSVEVLGAHLPAPARSGDVRQRDSPRGGYFQGSRAGGTSRAGGPSLPVELAVAGEEGVPEVLLNLLAGLDLTLDAAALCKSGSSELLCQPQLWFVHRQVAAPIRRCHNSISNAGLWSGTCVSRHQALRGLYGTAR